MSDTPTQSEPTLFDRASEVLERVPGWVWVGIGLVVVAELVRRFLVVEQPALPKSDGGAWAWEAMAAAWPPTYDEIDDEPDVVSGDSGHPAGYCTPLLGADADGDGNEAVTCSVNPWADPVFRPVDRGAPLAESASPKVPGRSRALWPLVSKHPGDLVTSYWAAGGLHGYSGRAFAADRETEDKGKGPILRSHAGVDLFAEDGDIVVAPEDATVLGIYPFTHGTWAVYLLTLDRKRLITLGEVGPQSWREFGIAPGMNVVQGQPLARVGKQTGGSKMLHVEIADASQSTDTELRELVRSGSFSWDRGKPAPRLLLDPSAYLVEAATLTFRRRLVS